MSVKSSLIMSDNVCVGAAVLVLEVTGLSRFHVSSRFGAKVL
jgi:hypothetical protein